MSISFRRLLGLGLLGAMLATTVPMFAAPQMGKKGAKKGSKKGGSKGSKGAQKKGGRGSSK